MNMQCLFTFVLLALSTLAGAQIQAPSYRAGESWTYREINGYNNIERATVVREVVQAEGTVRIVTRLADGKLINDAVYPTPGALASGALNDRARGTYAPSLPMYPYPLAEGQRWSNRVVRNDEVWKERRPTRIDGRIHGWETVRVPMGEFKALRIQRIIYVGDHDPFRGETTREEIEWYVPDLKMPVKLLVREYFREPPFDFPNYIQSGDWFIHELTAVKRGS
jgi:hypothetical protein